MVFGILTSVAAVPAIIGTTEAIRHGQRENTREEQRGRKNNLVVSLLRRSSYSTRFDGAYIVLKNNKLYVDTTGAARRQDLHAFTGYFLAFPGMEQVWKQEGFRRGEGLVTTISDDPPFLNWVYVDRETHEVKYGVRADAQPHLVGPFDNTKVDRRLTFQGWEGFAAVEETEGDPLWALYFDVEDDGLRGEGRVGTKDLRMLALEVWKREVKWSYDDAVQERLDRIQARREKDEESEETTVS